MFECDDLPTAGAEKVKVVPFESVKGFYEEFIGHLVALGDNEEDTPSLPTFYRAWKSFSNTVRLMRCKGNFSNCEICQNAADLLKGGLVRFNKEEREIILKFRRVHLKAQARQREALDLAKVQAKELDLYGQPQKYLVFSFCFNIYVHLLICFSIC